MTQEELDALMAGGLDEEDTAVEETSEESHNEDIEKVAFKETEVEEVSDKKVKVGEVFDGLENINKFMMVAKESTAEVIALVDSNIALFSTLCEKFPNVQDFSKALENNKSMKTKVEGLIQGVQDTEDEVIKSMDIVKYQDIHRQKIERVINAMRELSNYTTTLFEGKIEIDEDTNDDIEALIASLGVK